MPSLDPASCPSAPARSDLTVVGGGIVGLAVARELARRFPSSSVCVLERERELCRHQTGHNSGVIHAGVYYKPGSAKARLCVQGAAELYRYCEAHEIPHERCGKLIVAASAEEIPRLEELRRRGTLNGVSGLRRLDAEAIREFEPHARGSAGLYCPPTGIVDFKEVAGAYAGDLLEAGGTLVSGCEVRAVEPHSRGLRLRHSHGSTDTAHAIFCGGAWSDRLATLAGAERNPRIVPFLGSYLRLTSARRPLVKSLVYPVPDPSLPFLGVHFTRRIDGEVLIGPTAMLAGARDARGPTQMRLRDIGDTLGWPGSWRMFARWWRTGLTELHHAASRGALVRDAARYVPEITAADVEPSFTGVRAQAVAHNGDLVDDFVFSTTERALHVRNAPSPAATASLAIAREIADRAQRLF
ncbi:MAG TPA: L-2-hydroxyglutarate oxidase [Solirubrobacteraceae bacterium]|nr:L-2-hydroxyglutarate oxidase [Solirubrobacteraceae bacterium]